MVDSFLEFFGVNLLSIVTFLDVFLILIRVWVGFWIIRLIFNLLEGISPSGRGSIFRGL